MKQIRQIIDAIKSLVKNSNIYEDLLELFNERSNTFDALITEEKFTQWKHKISVIPESEGITSRWWVTSGNVTRVGPEAQINDNSYITTSQTGEYIVGKESLASGAIRVEGTPTSNSSDFWAGYSNRFNGPNEDGAGIGYSYFNQGEGDEGGALEDGDQEYVWFRSAVDGVPNKRVPRDQWNGDNISDVAPDKGNLIREGGFLREPHTFYGNGNVEIRWAFKTDDGDIDIRTLHRFNVKSAAMWSKSDLFFQAENQGTELTGYLLAAAYQSGSESDTIRENGEVRNGDEFGGTVTITAGTPIPLISIQKRAEWENINVRPVGISVDMDQGFVVFISIDNDLQGTNFSPPNNEVPNYTPDSSEYGVLSDNEATSFNSIGDIEYIQYVNSSGTGSGNRDASLSDTIPNFTLNEGQNATLGIIPLQSSTFRGSSLRWGANF